MNDAERSGVELVLPIDAVVSDDINNIQNASVKNRESFNAKDSGFDIGPKTTLLFMEMIKKSKTIVWNGPLGVAEKPVFAKGTNELAKFLNDLKGASTIIGGEILLHVFIVFYLKNKYCIYLPEEGLH